MRHPSRRFSALVSLRSLLLLSLGRGPGSVPLGLTLIEAQKYARRAEQLAVLKTFAEGELLRRLPFRNLVSGSLSFPAAGRAPPEAPERAGGVSVRMTTRTTMS